MRNSKPPLTWLQRAQIVRGTAKGLVYLHSKKPPIIHGDIKPANILLDQHLEAKIGDFGLARGGTTDPTKSFRSVSQVHGTSWYLPDDYKRSNRLCPKVDVFCFGISLFEVITAKSPSSKDPKSQREMRYIMLDEKTVDYLPWVDKNIEPSNFWEGHFFKLAKDCANEKRKKRPEIDKVLEYFDRIFFIYHYQLHGKRKNVSDPMKLQMYYDQKNRRNSNPHITNSNNPIASMARDSMEIGARALSQHPQGAGALIPPGGSTAPSDIEVPDLPAIIVNEESTEVK